MSLENENGIKKPTFSIFTLGCKTNLYESQQIVAALEKKGYRANFGLIWADVFIINTCAVTKEAESKSRQAIARVKKINPDCKVIIVGCAVTRDAEQFLKGQGVIAVAANSRKLAVMDIIDGVAKDFAEEQRGLTPNSQNKLVRELKGDFLKQYQQDVFAKPSHTRAFVKIQDGCNNFCSYCIVPYLRGRSRSRSIDDIIREVKANENANEFVLIGIDISQYGVDIGVTLSDLLNALSFCKARIRLGSIYQDCINEQLLEAMKDKCKHFHLSLQSGCDKTLLDMNRHYTTKQYADSVALIRKYYPDTAITTDCIVGFCGETEEDFAQTCAFVEEIGFADLHIFPYSPRKGTKAYGKPIPDALTVAGRVERLTAVKKRLHTSFLTKYLGKTMQILTEEHKKGFTLGYTDNYIKVYLEEKVALNQFVGIIPYEIYLDGVKAKLVK